jgi:hypothetical protein
VSAWPERIDLRPHYRAVAQALPEGAAIPVPREWLLELLAGTAAPAPVSPLPPADLTIPELARRYDRRPGTVREWCEAGRFPGAYKLNDREWRIPASAVITFDLQSRERPTKQRKARRKTARAGAGQNTLGAWRNECATDD